MTATSPRGLVAALAIGLVGAACQSAPAPVGAQNPQAIPTTPAPSSEAPQYVYVTGQDAGTVTVVDAVTLDVVATVDLPALGLGANPKPHHIAVEPDGSHWYVSLIGENRVIRFDRQNRIAGEIRFEVPGMLVLDRRVDQLYIGRSMSAVNPPQRIGVVDPATLEVEEVPVFFPRPHALTAHPAAHVVYSASLAENRMAVVEPEEEAVELVELPPPARRGGHEAHAGHAGHEGAPVHMIVQWAVSPDGRWLVGTGEMSNELLVYDVADPASPELVTSVAVEPRPWHPVFSPDGAEVWFANKGGNAVTVVDTDSWTVSDVIRGDGLAQPHGAAIGPDGRHVFVSNNNTRGDYPGEGGTLVVIDRQSREIVRVIEVGANATGVGTNAR